MALIRTDKWYVNAMLKDFEVLKDFDEYKAAVRKWIGHGR